MNELNVIAKNMNVGLLGYDGVRISKNLSCSETGSGRMKRYDYVFKDCDFFMTKRSDQRSCSS